MVCWYQYHGITLFFYKYLTAGKAKILRQTVQVVRPGAADEANAVIVSIRDWNKGLRERPFLSVVSALLIS